MSISSSYATPVHVNGYACKSCDEVAMAKRFIDPAHPKDGPFGINAVDPAAQSKPLLKASPPGLGGVVDISL